MLFLMVWYVLNSFLIVVGLEVFVSERLPRHVCVSFTFVKDVDDMHEQGEFFEVNETEFCLAADSLTHDACDDEAFKRDSGESFSYLIVIKTLSHKHAATTCASAEDGHVKVAKTDTFAVECAPLKLHEGVSLLHRLRECAGL